MDENNSSTTVNYNAYIIAAIQRHGSKIISSSEAEERSLDVIKSGFLTKRGHNVKSWRRRFFILLSDGTLSYLKKQEDSSPKGIIFVDGCKLLNADHIKPNCFSLTCLKSITLGLGNTKLYTNRTFMIHADNDDDRKAWMEHIGRIGGGGTGLSRLQFENRIDMVVGKLQRLDPTLGREFFTQRATILVDKEKFKLMYLDFDWTKTKKIYDDLKDETSRPKRSNSVGRIRATSNGEDAPPSPILQSTSAPNDLDIPQEMPDFDELESKYLSRYNPEKVAKQTLKIKIVITEIVSTKAQKNLRKILCPIVNSLGPYFDKDLPPFGLFHSALIIGPWYIEWTKAELCIPRKIMSKAAILSCDMPGIEIEKNKIEELKDKLATVITEWNGTKVYNNQPKDRMREGNCQDFVEDILRAIGVDSASYSTGPLGSYLTEMREKGICEIKFNMTPEFRSKFNIEEPSKTFKTHEELDRFVDSLIRHNHKFKAMYPNEAFLLKSFDRAFWLRHLRDPNNPNFQPLGHHNDHDNGRSGSVRSTYMCPFSNPMETRSFAIYDML